MKTWILGVALLGACSDTQNLGDRFTFRAPRWSLAISSDVGVAQANHVAVDGHGDLVVDGLFTHNVNFGTTTLTADTNENVRFWVGKRNGIDGSERWTHGLGMQNFKLGGVAADAQGDAFVTGEFSGSQDFGGLTVSSDADTFVAKYGPDGTPLWVKTLGLHSLSGGMTVSVSATGQVYVSVIVQNGFHSPQGETITGPYAIVAFAADGTMLWAQALPAAGTVAATSDGGAILGGVVTQSTTLGGTSIDLTRDGDCFAAKYDATGTVEWVRTFGDAGKKHAGMRLALDSADRVAAVVSGAPSSAGAFEALVDGSGVVWTAEPRSGDIAENSVTTYQDLVIDTGTARSPIDLGNGQMIGSTYLAARDATGALVDATVFGDPTLGVGELDSLATGSDGAIAFAGNVGQPIDFGTGVLGAGATSEHVSLVLGIMDPP